MSIRITHETVDKLNALEEHLKGTDFRVMLSPCRDGTYGLELERRTGKSWRSVCTAYQMMTVDEVDETISEVSGTK